MMSSTVRSKHCKKCLHLPSSNKSPWHLLSAWKGPFREAWGNSLRMKLAASNCLTQEKLTVRETQGVPALQWYSLPSRICKRLIAQKKIRHADFLIIWKADFWHSKIGDDKSVSLSISNKIPFFHAFLPLSVLSSLSFTFCSMNSI